MIKNESQNTNSDKAENGEERSSRLTYVFLIRHGENDWVDTGKLAGRTSGVHLNDKGRTQAEELAARLKTQPISAVYSSPLERCVETAEPLASSLGLNVQEEPGVVEVDYGDWRGAVLKDLSKKPEWKLVQLYPGGFRFPDGETLREVQNRVVSTLEHLRQQHEGEAIAVFAHGDVIRTSLAYYLGVPLDLFQRIHVSTASINLLAFHRFGPFILRMNDTGEIPTIKWKDEEKRDEDAKVPAEKETAN